MVLQECHKLLAALEPSKMFEENEPPRWTEDDLVKIMEMLIGAESNIVKYQNACQAFGKQVIDSMIKYNLIHMHPVI